ncbi:MAG: hypothetical protein EBY11_04135, partial [Proteobacteria bacterium]|nr:hypothetical protein [Pseudomonadota bacterium]
YTVSLEVAARDGLARVTLPSLSTGSFGYPVEEATRVATRAVVVPVPVVRRGLVGRDGSRLASPPRRTGSRGAGRPRSGSPRSGHTR